jgi:hypothetical protein
MGRGDPMPLSADLIHPRVTGAFELPGRAVVRSGRHGRTTVITAVVASVVLAVSACTGPAGQRSPAAIPEGWVTLSAGDLEVSVPPEWDVKTVELPEGAGSDAVLGGPCSYDLQGGPDAVLERPLAVVYVDEPTLDEPGGGCLAISSTTPPAHPAILIYPTAGRTEPDGAATERVGAVDAVRGEGGASWVTEFVPTDLASGALQITHEDDPVVQRIMETARPAS